MVRHLTDLERMVALLAAITHDIDHPGVNQAFLIATSDPLATLYKVGYCLLAILYKVAYCNLSNFTYLAGVHVRILR